ncbi:large ribosomal subunit protein mL62 [Culicoides brevitarsis]|uniref:large ribosomal subunit protein mL62 n=1 Tax=Culicoides brevitarsis TaxID=469753 RepID=UPI00307C052D
MLKSVRGLVTLTRNINKFPAVRCFCSDLSLKTLYPNSSLKITTPTPPPKGEKFNGFIPMNELEVTYSRSSGPGGQNINVVNTKCDLRFKFENVTFIPEETKKRLMEQYKNRITKEGYFVLKSELTRYQALNLADCLEKLRTLIRSAEVPEKKELSPEKKESLQKRQERANRERLLVKRHRSQVKADRQATGFE